MKPSFKWVLLVTILLGFRAGSAEFRIFQYSAISAEFRQDCTNNNGIILLHDTCYFTGSGPGTYDDAKSYCASKDAHLLSLTTPEEIIHLNFEGLLDTDEMWIGLETVVKDEYVHYIDNLYTTMYTDQLTTNWTNGDNQDGAACMATVKKGAEVVLRPCETEYPYLCKIQFYPYCYPSWIYDAEKQFCYRMFGTDFDNVDHMENRQDGLPRLGAFSAANACQSYLNSHLVTTFEASFIIHWSVYWRDIAPARWKAWIGVFYNPDSSTGLVRDDGAEVALVGQDALFFIDYNRPSSYKCGFYQSEMDANKTDARIKPTDTCDVKEYYFCQMGDMQAVEAQYFPKESTTPETTTGLVPTEPMPAPPVPMACRLEGPVSYSWYNVNPNTRLVGQLIATVGCSSRIEGAIRCSNYPGCKSFNYIYTEGNSECQLNSEVTAETINEVGVDHIFLNCGDDEPTETPVQSMVM